MFSITYIFYQVYNKNPRIHAMTAGRLNFKAEGAIVLFANVRAISMLCAVYGFGRVTRLESKREASRGF